MLVQMALAVTMLQSSSRGVAVTGVVQDQTGAVLPGARVVLAIAGGSTAEQSVSSDASGAFRFERVPSGAYDIRTEFSGFKLNIAHVRVAARAPGPVRVVMQIEGLTQEVSVSGGGGQTSAEAAANLNAITIDEDTLDDLPVLDQDVVGAMSRFLDSSAIGTGGTTILVDGGAVRHGQRGPQLQLRYLDECRDRTSVFADDGSGPLSYRHRERPPGRRAAQQSRRSRIRERRSALVARVPRARARWTQTVRDDRRGRVQRSEHGQLLVLRRQPQLAVLRSGDFRATAAENSILAPDSLLGSELTRDTETVTRRHRDAEKNVKRAARRVR